MTPSRFTHVIADGKISYFYGWVIYLYIYIIQIHYQNYWVKGYALSGISHTHIHRTFLVAQMVKRLPKMRKTQVQSLGQEDLLEKEMATHSSILAWKIPWTEEPGGLQSMGSQRVRHDWATSLSHFTFMHWRRTRQPTPVFLPREPQGLRGLVGCRPWGHTDSDTTETT